MPNKNKINEIDMNMFVMMTVIDVQNLKVVSWVLVLISCGAVSIFEFFELEPKRRTQN